MTMIKINGVIGFTLGFNAEFDMTEEQWMNLKESEQMELIVEQFDRHDYNNMETDSLEVWDLDEVEDTETTESA